MAPAPLSVVIPILTTVPAPRRALDALEEGRAMDMISQVLLVDEAIGQPETGPTVTVIHAGTASRGRQLAAGGAAASGPWILFLHGDTALAPGWSWTVARYIARPDAAARAGYFHLGLDDPSPQARRIERLANWRARRLHLPYGDQGLLIHRDLYQQVGGFRPLPLMEDVDLVRRLGGRRLVALDGQAVTSATRYRNDGWWARPLRNLCLLSLYFLGLPPAWLRRLYG